MRKSIRLFATVNGETGTWRTLSKAEWDYILKTRDNASSLRAWKGLDGAAQSGDTEYNQGGQKGCVRLTWFENA